jgi:RNA polymerase sigma factor (sigma-70 family)
MTPPLDLATHLERHAAALRRLANALLRDPAAADDAVQDTCVAALQHPPRHGTALGGWLATLLRNAVRATARADRRRSAREHAAALARGDAATDHAATFARAELAQRLIAAVQQLAEPYGSAVWQRWFEGRPPRAIARARGVPVATVKSWLKRGLGMLRDRLGKDGSDWRAGFAAAFGLGEAVAGSAALTTGGLVMATWTKGVAAAAAVVLVAAWWWTAQRDGAPQSPPQPAGAADAASAVAANGVATAGERLPAPAPAAAASADPAAASTPAAGALLVAPGGVVRGRAVDAGTNEPLAGVLVRRDPTDWRNPVDAIELVTVADGRFELPARVGASTGIHLRRADRVTMAFTERVAAGDTVDLGDVAMRAGRVISGRVVDRDGGAIEPQLFVGCDFELRAAGRCRERQAPAYTAEHGVFATREPVPLDAATRWSIPFGDVMLPAPIVLTIGATEPREVVLEVVRRPRITGVVVDAAGAPIANAGLGEQPGWPDVRSTADGAFTLLQRRPTAAATIHVVECDGCAPPAALRDVPWGTSNVRIVVERVAPFAIDVAGAGGEVVEQFGVVLRRDFGLGPGSGTVRQRGTHAGGRLAVTDVVRGRTAVAVVPVSARWEPSGWIAVGADATEPLRVELVPRRRLQLAVVRGGEALAGAELELVREVGLAFRPGQGALQTPATAASIGMGDKRCELLDRATTDGSGRAAPWAPVDLAPVVVCVRVPGEPPLLRRGLAWPAAGEALVVDVPAIGQLRARIALGDQDRDAVRLVLPLAHDAPHRDRKPLHDGSLEPVSLHAGPQPYEWQRMLGGWQTIASGTVDVPANGVAELELDLGAHVLGSVRGTVRGNGPLPRDLAVVLLRRDDDGTLRATASAPVAADGAFAASGVQPGRYRVAFAASSPGGTPAVQADELVVVAGGEAAVTLRHEPRRLVVTLTRADGAPVRAARVLTHCGDTTWPAFRVLAPSVDGELVLDPAPALPVQFREWTEGTRWSEPVTANAGGTTAVTVVLPGAR